MSVMVSEGKTMASDGMEVDSGKGRCRGARKGTLGFRQRGDMGRAKMRVFLALNRATSQRSDATSRRSREESSQRHDVEIQRRDVLERGKINFAILRSKVTTFQRGAKPTSRHFREVQSQHHDVPEKGISQSCDVDNQRRDVPEKGQTDVATLRRHDFAMSRH